MSTQSSDIGSAGPARRFEPVRTFTESKLGTKTSEFYVAVIAILAVLIATYTDGDSLERVDGWRFAIYVAMAYIVSRGLAKLGTREPYTDE